IMSLRGSGRRRQRSHSVALLVWFRGRDQMAIDMFCGKRHEEDSSNKGLQLLLSLISAFLLHSFICLPSHSFHLLLSNSEYGFYSTCAHGQLYGAEKRTERRERRTWTPSDDVVLISSWLNTTSPKVAPGEEREGSHCKQRWHKINDLVSKFSGAYEAATREKTSGQNETDVLKHAHEIYYINYKKKFTLEHAWKELRNDQKWCANESSNKRRKFDDGSYSASESAAKARGKKKPVGEGKEFSEFQTMWSIKKADLDTKERLGKMKLLDSLIAKQGPLALASLVSFRRVALACSIGVTCLLLF
ncbi:BnaCnng73840D, partial [Brassica napus]